MSQVKTKFKRNTKSDISSFLMLLALISLMAGGWHISRKKARFNEMIKQNKIVVPAIKGAELGSLVYISCVSSALSL